MPPSSNGSRRGWWSSTTQNVTPSTRSTRSIIAKLLHQPSLRLKQQAGTPQGERNAAAVVDLFDLG